MSDTMNLNVRISGALKEFVSHELTHGSYENISEYIRDLIRRDKARSEQIIEVNGFYTRYEKHYIYWKALQSGQIGIVTVLHERTHQMERLREDMV